MPKRSEKRDTAKAAYVERRGRGEKINLRKLAEELGADYDTLRKWKAADHWDEALPKKKRGGQPGNKNSAGKKNAAGSHPTQLRNKNAEKDGAYSTVFFDTLSDAERDLIEKTPLGSRAALEHEMKILKYRENRILLKIAEYEAAPEDELYVSSVLDMREPRGGQDGAKQQMGMYTKDSAFSRVQKLQEALYKVQGRIAKIADSLRALEEFETRTALERERLDIMRIRALGMVDTPEDEADTSDLGDIEIEDALPDGGGGGSHGTAQAQPELPTGKGGQAASEAGEDQ